MRKSDLRKMYKAKRNLFSPQQVQNLSLSIRDHFFANVQLKQRSIHCFISIDKFNEVDTSMIIEKLFELKNPVGTSIMHYDSFTTSHVWINEQTQYELDKFEIPTPVNEKPARPDDFDIVIIPLLICDNDGNRVGYGKGIYDRFLSECKPECIKIGVCFFEPSESIDDLDAFDIPLNHLITPENYHTFS